MDNSLALYRKATEWSPIDTDDVVRGSVVCQILYSTPDPCNLSSSLLLLSPPKVIQKKISVKKMFVGKLVNIGKCERSREM